MRAGAVEDSVPCRLSEFRFAHLWVLHTQLETTDPPQATSRSYISLPCSPSPGVWGCYHFEVFELDDPCVHSFRCFLPPLTFLFWCGFSAWYLKLYVEVLQYWMLSLQQTLARHRHKYTHILMCAVSDIYASSLLIFISLPIFILCCYIAAFLTLLPFCSKKGHSDEEIFFSFWKFYIFWLSFTKLTLQNAKMKEKSMNYSIIYSENFKV